MRYALTWNGRVLRPHLTEDAAKADLQDCLKRRTEDVARALPVTDGAGRKLACSLCPSADHDHSRHHLEHIGTFEVEILESAPAEPPSATAPPEPDSTEAPPPVAPEPSTHAPSRRKGRGGGE